MSQESRVKQAYAFSSSSERTKVVETLTFLSPTPLPSPLSHPPPAKLKKKLESRNLDPEDWEKKSRKGEARSGSSRETCAAKKSYGCIFDHLGT